MSGPIHIHGDSARVGVQLAMLYLQGSVPPADVIERVIGSAPSNIIRDEFPLGVLTVAAQSRMQRRRDCAMQSLAALIHHAGDSQLLTSDHMEKLVELAWSAARCFEQQDNAAVQIDTLEQPPKSVGT